MSFVPPEESLQAVVFDLDGLLVNTEDLYEVAGQRLLARRKLTMTDALRIEMMGRPLPDSMQLLIETHQLDEGVQSLQAECETDMKELIDEHMQTTQGVNDLLQQLAAAGLPAAVATSGLRHYAEDVLHRCQITEHFRFVLTAEDIENGKPAPDIYLLAAEQLGIAASRMMVLEDSQHGCRAAISAAAYAVAVPNRHTTGHDFSGAALVADSLADSRILLALGL